MKVKRMRVVHIVSTLGMGGTEKTVELIAKNLPKNKFEITVIAFNSGGMREENLTKAGIPTLILNGDLKALELYLDSHQVDLIHIHHVCIALSVFRSIRLILHHQFSQPLYSEEDYKHFEFVIFNSQRTRQKFLELTGWKFNPKQAVVVYNPVETEILSKTVESISKSYVQKKREEYGISREDIVIGRLGRPDIVKWSDTLVYAIPLLISEIPNIKIIIQFAPTSRAWFLRHSPWRSHLVINPTVDEKYDIACFFRLIDIYVHASKIGESFGMSLAEAGACQRPVVVTSTPQADNAQIEVIDHEKTGIVVDNPVTFAKAIIALSKDPKRRKTMGAMGQKKVYKMYDTSTVVKQIEKLYLHTNDKKQNQKEYLFWKKEYCRRILDIIQVKQNMNEKLYLQFISLFSSVTRVTDMIEHHL